MTALHTDDFRREAVRISLTSGLTRRQVASDLGVGLSTLSKWIQRSSPDDRPPAHDIDLAKENNRLRKENHLLSEEREILKRPPCSSRSKANKVCFH
ncbi:transposase [Paenochrobactrum gallinarii]|uniref:Transposase n=1 Tax=Paenochrobactrum gallinarii TaxID=643673 RepID=A0A841LTP2_9HYPH|nr:transposase [Paenochrobactrum gallinarii]